MRRYARKHGVNVQGFSKEALKVLNNHSWPGNVRELQNVVERAVILCGENGVLEPETLGLNRPTVAPPTQDGSPTASEDLPLAELEKRHILSVLDRCKGNRTHAARILGVSIRTLRNKLHEYNGTEAGLDENEPVEEQG